MTKKILFISTALTLASSTSLMAVKGSEFIDALHGFSDEPYNVTAKVGFAKLSPSTITIALKNDLDAKRDPHLPHIMDFASDETLDNYMTSLLIQQLGAFLISRMRLANEETTATPVSLPDPSDQGFEDAQSEVGDIAPSPQDTPAQETSAPEGPQQETDETMVTSEAHEEEGSPQSLALKIPKTAFMYTALKHANTYQLDLASGSNSTTQGLMSLSIEIEPETMPEPHWISYGINMTDLGDFIQTIRMTLLRKIKTQITERSHHKAKHAFYN